jgi:hypothetical protein
VVVKESEGGEEGKRRDDSSVLGESCECDERRVSVCTESDEGRATHERSERAKEGKREGNRCKLETSEADSRAGRAAVVVSLELDALHSTSRRRKNGTRKKAEEEAAFEEKKREQRSSCSTRTE